MREITLNIFDFTNDNLAIDDVAANSCKEYLLLNYDEDTERIVLDFNKITNTITRFLNPIIGDLVKKMGPEIVPKLFIVNYNDDILTKVRIVVNGSLK